MLIEHTAHKHSNTLLWCRLRVEVSGSECTHIHTHTRTQYVSPREEAGGCHGDMARQPLVHSHKTERKVSQVGRWAKGKTLFKTFLVKKKLLCNRCSFLCHHSFHFFWQILSEGNKWNGNALRCTNRREREWLLNAWEMCGKVWVGKSKTMKKNDNFTEKCCHFKKEKNEGVVCPYIFEQNLG